MPKYDGTPTRRELRLARRQREAAESMDVDRYRADRYVPADDDATHASAADVPIEDATADDDERTQRARDAGTHHASGHAHANARTREGGEVCRTPARSRETKILSPDAPAVSISSSESSVADVPPEFRRSDAGDVRWVMEHLHDAGASELAPSAVARSLWRWARSGPVSQNVFVRDIYAKAFVSRDEEEGAERDRRSAVEYGGMLERCMEAAERGRR